MTNTNLPQILFQELAQIIEQGKQQVAVQVNSTLTLVYWQVGQKINDHILDNQRAEYGKEIISSLSIQLSAKFGKSFEAKNLRRMMQFANVFCDYSIVAPAARQLSWSHFIILIPLKNTQAQNYYIKKSVEENWGKESSADRLSAKLSSVTKSPQPNYPKSSVNYKVHLKILTFLIF